MSQPVRIDEIQLPTGPAPAAPSRTDLAATEMTAEQLIRVEAINAAIGGASQAFGAHTAAELLDQAAEFEAYIRDGRS